MTDDEIKKLIEDGKAREPHRDTLRKLAAGVYCLHRSWGFGKIATYDQILGKFLVDFRGKPGHAMDVAYAAESLEPLSDEHILVRKITDLDAVKKLAVTQPLELMRIVLTSFGGQAVPDQIAAALSPDVIAPEDWKKWWEGAKRAMKKDPHFGVGAKKTEPCLLRGEPLRPEQEALKAFEDAAGLRDKLAAAERLLRVADQVADREHVIAPVVRGLSAQIEKAMHQEPATALEAIWVRDELAELQGQKTHLTVEQTHEILRNVRHLGELLESLPAGKPKRVLPQLRTLYPETWHDTLRQLLATASLKLAGDIIEFLVAEGQGEAVGQFLERTVREQTATSELLLWICRSRHHQAMNATLASVLNIRLLSAILEAMQREQFATTRKKNLLLEYLLSDPNLVSDLVRDADIEEVRDAARKLLMHPAVNEMDRRSLLGRIIKQHPPIQSLLISGTAQRAQAPIVSWESLEQRKAEYDELITRRIPENSKDIAIARSYGDLSENYEFKAAKETQRVLMARKAELENMLANARGTDFADTRSDSIGIGTVITLHDFTENRIVRYAMLGAWDSDVDRGIISYQTALAQALMNKKPGDEADFEIGGHRHHVRVDKIERYADLKEEIGPPILPKPAPAASA
jgi:transcription elongation GreA/GreB family factor